ncbi:MAG: aldehyde dehydrogenase family protein [Candidatus Dadabacteria bacterium]|nr:MAG: aldehyde dehydrogenase family protein [Candidatus Dadabacteria bacterium]
MSKARKIAKNDSLELISAAQNKAEDKRLEVLKTYKLYIGGAFPRTESGRYWKLKTPAGKVIANVSRASRKDFRNAVVAARRAFSGWAAKTAYNRGQILYRMAEMLEGRREQFISELVLQGSNENEAVREVNAAIDRLVYYAGWADKYQQVFSAVNPVQSSHFNFSLPEPMGVVAVIAPESHGLLGLVSCIAPVIVGGNSCVVLSSEKQPLSSITFAELMESSDVPAGAINILTGFREELLEHFSSHMDVNAVVSSDLESAELKEVQSSAVSNLKRVINLKIKDWFSDEAQNPYLIMETQEIKTTWHPIGL